MSQLGICCSECRTRDVLPVEMAGRTVCCIECGALVHVEGNAGLESPATPYSGKAIVSLVLGITSLNVAPLVGAVLAIVFGHLALRDIEGGSGERGRGMAIAGLVLGWVGVGLMLLLVAVFVGILTLQHFL